MDKILLALVLGFVLRFISTVGVTHYLKTSKTDAELKAKFGFHACIISYVVGSGLKYIGITLMVAYIIYKYILS